MREAAIQRCSVKNLLTKKFQNSYENTCVGVSVLIILGAEKLQLLKRDSVTGFTHWIWWNFKNTFFVEYFFFQNNFLQNIIRRVRLSNHDVQTPDYFNHSLSTTLSWDDFKGLRTNFYRSINSKFGCYTYECPLILPAQHLLSDHKI